MSEIDYKQRTIDMLKTDIKREKTDMEKRRIKVEEMEKDLELILMEAGTYEPKVVKKGEEETTLKLKEGDTFFTVKLEDGYLDVETQTEAELVSRLVRIEQLSKEKN